MIGLFALFLYKGKTDDFLFLKTQKETNNFLCDEINGKFYYLKRRVLSKFPEDKLFLANKNIILCTDGVFLNNSVKEKYDNNIDFIIQEAYKKNNLKMLINKLRGVFSGIVIDTNKQQICVFTDHLALKPIFYMIFDRGIIVSSEVNEISEFCKLNHIDIHLDIIGSYSMLSYGYMYGDYTLIKEVKRLREGNILYYSNGKISFEIYHKINTKAVPISKEKAICRLDELFCQSLTLEVEKNKTHHYEDVIPLSAGMDCRMTSYVYRKIFHQHAINFTYSETGEYDFIEPSKMAHELQNKWIFKSLDNGLDLYNIDESIKLSDGLVYYAAPAQLGDFLRLVNTQNWGIIHTGVLGDVVIGATYIKEPFHTQYSIGDGAYSIKMVNKLKKYLCIGPSDYEVGMIQNRGINGICLGYSLTFRHYAEDLSPFLNIDFFDFCLSLPLELRQKHNLYYAWVERFYPDVQKYKHNGVSIKGHKKIKFSGKEYRIRAIPDLLKNTIKSKFKTNYGMNPIQSWYNSNPELRKIMEDYYVQNKDIIAGWKELAYDVDRLFFCGNVIEKVQAISLLGSVKMLF